jgi:hypothetical protein
LDLHGSPLRSDCLTRLIVVNIYIHATTIQIDLQVAILWGE